MEIAEYVRKIRDFAGSYFQEDKVVPTTKRCCICLNQQVLTIIAIDRHSDVNEILMLEQIKLDDIKSLPLILKGLVEKYQLSRTPLSWLLGPEDYQINVIDAMPVPENEFRTALAWRIRSLITYPVSEAVMEYFELPSKKNATGSPLICSVTAQKNLLNPYIDIFKNAGLQMAKIEIPEIAMLNLSSLYESDEKSTAFFYFTEKFVIMNISFKKTLYFTRRINLVNLADSSIDFEKLGLEILRYFDFFRIQWRLSTPTRLFAATDRSDITSLTKGLTERLMNNVEAYQLKTTLLSDNEKIEISNKYLLNYGCLLK